jgi:hypothetical protein
LSHLKLLLIAYTWRLQLSLLLSHMAGLSKIFNGLSFFTVVEMMYFVITLVTLIVHLRLK